jgi:hypothetical protein
MLIQYDSNNSGGSWWLEDKDWFALQEAGWKIIWAWEDFVYDNNGERTFDAEGFSVTEQKEGKDSTYRWLGCMAKYAFKNFDNIGDCLREFEKITGQNVCDEGCNCCGAPHSFSWDDEYCSGEGCAKYLYKTIPDNFRHALDLINKKQ